MQLLTDCLVVAWAWLWLPPDKYAQFREGRYVSHARDLPFPLMPADIHLEQAFWIDKEPKGRS